MWEHQKDMELCEENLISLVTDDYHSGFKINLLHRIMHREQPGFCQVRHQGSG